MEAELKFNARAGDVAAAKRDGEAALELRGIVKRYGQVTALDEVALRVTRGELLTILGPSGSGKTTLLKAIAGFEQIDAGVIVLDGTEITDMAPARRHIGMVFQNYALFPHLTVWANVAFPLKMRRMGRDAIDARVRSALALVALEDFSQRYPAQLSGGQQQRVALARAIVFEPKLLLLDEPLGALDRKLREAMQLELRRLQRRLGLTTIFITHDQEEALSLSDRIAVMQAGRIVQIGSPRDLYEAPNNPFIADFVGEASLWRGRIVASDGERTRVLVGARIELVVRAGANDKPGDEVLLVLRPEAVRPAHDGTAVDNNARGVVRDVVYVGGAAKYRVEIEPGIELLWRAPARRDSAFFAVGDAIDIGWSSDDMHRLEAPPRAGGP